MNTNKWILCLLALGLVGVTPITYASREGDVERMRNANSAQHDSGSKSTKQSEIDKLRENTKENVNRSLSPPIDRVRSDTSRNTDRVLRK